MFEQSGSQEGDEGDRFDDSSRHARFPTTNWSEIGKLVATNPVEAKQAFNGWVLRYRRPLVAFFRSQGYQSQDANDLTQSLLLHLYEKEKFKQLAPNTHLRHWLLAIAKNWLKDAYRHDHAEIRRPEGGVQFLSQIAVSSDAELPVIDIKDPELAFNASWRKEVLSAAYEAAAEECRRRNRLQDFELFFRYYVAPLESPAVDETLEKPTWEFLANEYGLESARVASGKADWVKRVFRDSVRLEIRRYVGSEDEVEDELRKLLVGEN